MVRSRVAHFADPTQWPASGVVVALIVAVISVTLIVEHTITKHGQLRAKHLRAPVAIAAALSIAALLAPLPSSAQSRTPFAGLPDLISDPPQIWFTRDVPHPATGEIQHVLAFDGYVHNIGDGNLEVSGNPQIEGGMQQRVFDGDQWEAVSSPTVKFETDDGHNHFHLMEAVHYALWNDARTAQISDAQKVGFCLIDTEQREEVSDPFYLIDDSNYCGVDTPDATELTMGITAGWRDTYDANVSLQWVDVSNVEPGRYWVSAITDPNDEIVESNEDNNDIVFSRNRFAVPGYVARQLPLQDGDNPIRLEAEIHGEVGPRAFVIVDGPSNGALDVPLNVDLATDQVRYIAEPGFSGTDSFSYYAHDITTPFPAEPDVVTVMIEASGQSSTQTDGPTTAVTETALAETADDQDAGSLVLDGTLDLEVQQPASLPLDIDDRGGVEFFGRNLPPGLRISSSTGEIFGVPTFAGAFDAEIVTVNEGAAVATPLAFAVAPQVERGSLEARNDFSIAGMAQATIRLGRGSEGAEYQVSGLPEGIEITQTVPILGGTPTEAGTFDIEITERIDGDVTKTISFLWTIRAANQPAFVL